MQLIEAQVSKNNLDSNHGFATIKYDIDLTRAKEIYDHLQNTGTWLDPFRHTLYTDRHLKELPRRYTGPDQTYRENAFLWPSVNGSHWVEFFNEGKLAVKHVYAPYHSGLLEKMIPVIKQHLGVDFEQARDRIGNNLKSAVQKASKYEAQINDLFLEFANHYQASIMPARSYKPRDKALVENAVNIAYSRIYAPLRNQVFYSLASLNQAIADLLEAHNNMPFQRVPQSRRQRFETQEKHLLQPLAAERYELRQFREMTVMKNSHVQLHDDHHYYSVPYRYIGKKVKIIYSSSHVSVFCNKERIAHHMREHKAYGYTTHQQHLPSSHQFVSEWNPDKFISWAARIDPVVKDYITHILQGKTYPEQAYRSCVGILSQEKKVGRDRLIGAVQRATEFGNDVMDLIQQAFVSQSEAGE